MQSQRRRKGVFKDDIIYNKKTSFTLDNSEKWLLCQILTNHPKLRTGPSPPCDVSHLLCWNQTNYSWGPWTKTTDFKVGIFQAINSIHRSILEKECLHRWNFYFLLSPLVKWHILLLEVSEVFALSSSGTYCYRRKSFNIIKIKLVSINAINFQLDNNSFFLCFYFLDICIF